MELSQLNGKQYYELLQGGMLNLYNNITIVNNLNVFPIPDGDTGDNMWMTIDGGVQALNNNEDDSIGVSSKKASEGMLMHARGNSGAILSQYFAGIADGLSNYDSVDFNEFLFALQKGVTKAYTAVLVPTEGTILTVAREATEYVQKNINNINSFVKFFEYYLTGMKESLDRTPELLDVLKEAGVVDSGGAGLLYIIDGMLKVLKGEEISSSSDVLSSNKQNTTIDYSKFTEDSVMEYGYCTEFLLRLQNSKVDVKNFDENIIINFLNSVGDSVVCFKTDSIIKAHVHTFKPGDVFNEVQKYGEFLTLKVENMNIQHENSIVENAYSVKKTKKLYGIVTVATGEGIINTFKELGVDEVIQGGQSMNPSTEDFINAFKNINADTIFVFPNNSNVILTAKLASELYTDAQIKIIETKNIGEGYASISMFDPTAANVEELEQSLIEAFEGIQTGMVSPCVRDSNLNGVETHVGEFVGFLNKKIITSQKTAEDALLDMADKLNASDYSVIIIISGKETSQDKLECVKSQLHSKYKFADIYTIDGGQDIYNYILILE